MEEVPKGVNEWEKASDEERWNMLNPDNTQNKDEGNKTEDKPQALPDLPIKNQFDAAFPELREEEEKANTSADTAKTEDTPLNVRTDREYAEAARTHREPALWARRARDEQLKEEIQSAELPNQGTQKENSVVSTEVIENFVPVESVPERRDEIKKDIAKTGGFNQMLIDFWNWKESPKDDGQKKTLVDFWAWKEGRHGEGKQKEPKKESKASNTWEKTKEWLAKPSWIKERLKGVGTMGVLEIIQAGKFRVAKKNTGRELAEASTQIQSKSGLLTYAEALEAHKRMAAGEKLEEGPTKEKFEKIACEVKRERNLIYINQVLQQADQKLQERLHKYRDVNGKQVQLDPENRRRLLGALGAKLVSMQDSTKEADIKEFSDIIKFNLDPNYWKRYIYGGAEAGIWAAGTWWYTSGSESALVKGPAEYAVPLGSESAPSKLTLKAGENPWDVLKAWLQQNGIPNPTDMQIQATDTIASHSTGYGVPSWDIPGSPLDTQLPESYEIDVSEAFRKLEWIKNLHK